MDQKSKPPAPERLENWKEISAYFGVTIRTVQLWEQQQGLPVRRLPGPRGRVFAFSKELDAWQAARESESLQTPGETAIPAPPSSRKPWIALSVFAVLAAAGWLVNHQLDKAPLAGCRMDGQILIALDQKGREAWRYDLGHPIAPDARRLHQGLIDHKVLDLDGDGRRELIFADLQLSGTGLPDRILCFASDGGLLWSFQPGRKVRTITEEFRPVFRVMEFRAVRIGPREGTGLFVASVQEPYYPFQGALLSPRGQVLREYWHSGHIFFMSVGDLNRDGTDEIYLSGVSNARKAATMVVLDPRTMSGASLETDPRYQLQGFGPPREIARILFPVCRPAIGIAEYGTAMPALLSDGEIIVSVDEVPWAQSKGQIGPSVLFHFTPSLEFRIATIVDNYQAALAQLGRPNERVTPDDIEALRNITYLTRPPGMRGGQGKAD